MPGAFPTEALLAEAFAAPLTMPSAYRAALVCLARRQNESEGDTRDLEEDLIRTLQNLARGTALDQLRLLIARAWFPPGVDAMPLSNHLVRVARRYLRHHGTAVVLRDGNEREEEDEPPATTVASTSRWRRMSVSLPPDILIAALSAHARCPPQESVELGTRQLDHLLRSRDCAEGHLHIGAAFPFQALWTGKMIELLDLRGSMKQPAEASHPMGGGASMLAVAGVARLLMAAFLVRRRGTWCDFLTAGGDLDDIFRRCVWPLGAFDAARTARDAIEALEVGRAPKGRPLQRLLVALTGAHGPRSSPASITELFARDPLHGCFGHRADGPITALGFAESSFATEALRYLLNEGAQDRGFERIFFQYQRVRVAIYRQLTQRPERAGLDWFTRYYRGLSAWRGPLHERCFLFALLQQSKGLRLAALEGRTAPEPRWTDNRKFLRGVVRDTWEFHESSGIEAPPEVGVVLHFVKNRTRASSRAEIPHALVAVNGGMRHGEWLRARRREAEALCRLLEVHPEALLVLRGLDVANVETAQPTWAFAPWIAMVRDASVGAAARAARLFPEAAVRPLAVTLHAGESYHRLSEGVRRMHEAMLFGVVRGNGRFGHGLALGVDPTAWVRDHAVSQQPLEERLDDLCWEFHCYQSRFAMPPRGRVSWLRAEIERLGHRLYVDRGRAEDFVACWDHRHGKGVVESAMDRRGENLRAPGVSLLDRYFYDDEVARRGMEVVEVEGRADEADAISAIQRSLREMLASCSVCIEANPSSNLLIGDHAALREHPAFRLQPLEPRDDLGPPVLLSVNTDNPTTMSSRLSDENAYLLAEMLGLGASPSTSLAWIDRAREDGMASRFTLSATRSLATLERLARMLDEF